MDRKKIFRIVIIVAALLSALASIVGLVSLLLSDDAPEKDEFDLLAEEVSSHSPTLYDCSVSYKVSESLTLNGKYLMYIADDGENRKIKLEYSYDRLGEVGSPEGFMTTLEGTFYADSEEKLRETMQGYDMPMSPIIPALSKQIFESYEISQTEERVLLSGRLKSVSGARFELECTPDNKQPIKLSIAYTDERGVDVCAVYIFSYEAQDFEEN